MDHNGSLLATAAGKREWPSVPCTVGTEPLNETQKEQTKVALERIQPVSVQVIDSFGLHIN